MIGPIPAVVVGAALLVAAFLVVSFLVARRPKALTILVGVTILSIAFFLLPTRVHERYLFPFVALGAVLAAVSIRWRIAYAVLSATLLLNMYVVLTTIYTKNPGITDWFHVGATLRSEGSVTLIVLAALGAAIWSFGQLRPAGLRGLARELEASGGEQAAEDAAEEEAWSGEAGPRERHTGSMTRPTRAVAASTSWQRPDTTTVPLPMWSEPPSLGELGPVAWFRAKLDQRPVRADRSRGLHDEPSGRLDRLDLWILVVLVATILGVRLYRLSEPYQMHFDEVYHARTATEFLQSWRYGIDHDIYEYTHPHLAKYAMAGGLVAWGDDRVTATSSLGAPILDAVIEKQVSDPLVSGRAGDRVDVVTGSELRFYDLLTRHLIASMPLEGASTLAIDTAARRLFIGSTDGSIWRFELSTLDVARSTGSPDRIGEPALFGTVDGAVTHLYPSDDATA